jgi:heme exporter protein A
MRRVSALAPAPVAPRLADGAPARRALLSARELACRRGDRLLFRGLDLDVGPGDVVWLRGANGCGKTSLLRQLVGLAPAAEGRLERGEAARHAVYVGHANALKDDLTALEALLFLARLQGAAADAEACAAALRRFGVHAKRQAMVRTLSQGQRRRVALARLLLAPAGSLWVLDEPFDALDADGCATLREALSAHARGGGAVVLTSHVDPGLGDPAPTVLQLDEVAAR